MRITTAALLISTSAWAGTLSTSPNPFDFANVSVSAGPVVGIVSVTNTGSNTNVTGFSMGTGCGEFTASAASTLLTNGAMLTVDVSYDPVDRAADSCTVTIQDSNAAVDTFVLTGGGLASQLSVSGPLTFANQRWNGGTPQVLNITLTNSGEEPVTAAQLVANLTTGTHFSIGSLSGTIAAAGGTATLPITFDPTSFGAKTDTVVIGATNDSPGDGNQSVVVDGIATESRVGVASPLGFGNVLVGSPVTSPLSVSNPGTAQLHISAMSITGSTDFAFTDHGCTNQTCLSAVTVDVSPDVENFGIRCAPSTTGAKSGLLTITSDAPLSPTTVALSCTGTFNELTVSPTSVPFPATRVGTPATDQTFTVSNTTGALVGPLQYDVVESLADYAIACTPACTGTLDAGESALVTVTFTPTSTGAHNGSISVSSNDLDEPLTQVNVSGSGTASSIAIAPDPLAFGSVDVGSTADGGFTLTNAGTASLNVMQMTLTDDAGFSFAFASGLCTTGTTCARAVTASASGGTADVPIRCAPTSAGVKVGQISFTSDAPGSPHVATLSCTGLAPVAQLDTPASLVFGTVLNGNNSPGQAVTVRNSGAGVLSVSSVTSDAPADFDVSGPGVATIGAGLTETWMVACDPETRGPKSGTLQVLNANAAPLTVALTCTSVGAQLVLFGADGGAQLDFGALALDAGAGAVLTVVNVGDAPATLAAVTLGDAGAGFSVSGFTPNTLLDGDAGTTLTVTFAPRVAGSTGTTLTVESEWNDPVVTLTGSGTPPFLVGHCSVVSPVSLGDIAWNGAAERAVTVQNTGTAPFMLVSATPTSNELEVLGFIGGMVSAGANRIFSVRASPSDDLLGPRSAGVSLASSLSGGDACPPLLVTFNSIGPAVSVEPASLEFGTVIIGGQASLQVTVTNTGDGEMVITDVSGLTAPFSNAAPTALRVAPGAQTTLEVTYAPTAVTSSEAQTLVVTTSGLYFGGARQPPAFSVGVSGMGVEHPVDAKPGCGCQSGAGALVLAALAGLARHRRRRHSQP